MKGIIDIKNEYNHLPHLTFLLEICKVYAPQKIGSKGHGRSE